MARILWAETLARGATGGLFAMGAVSIWLAWRRRARGSGVRLVAGGLGMVLLSWPIWAIAQEYLFLFSILPGLWPWFAGTSLVAGGSFLAFALGPARAS